MRRFNCHVAGWILKFTGNEGLLLIKIGYLQIGYQEMQACFAGWMLKLVGYLRIYCVTNKAMITVERLAAQEMSSKCQIWNQK